MQTIGKLIGQYGNPMVLISSGEETQIRAFLQETQSRSKDNAQREFSPLGEGFKGVYVYIGPVSPVANVGDEIVYQQRRFELRRAELVLVGGKSAYCWGLCVEKGGDSTWGSES